MLRQDQAKVEHGQDLEPGTGRPRTLWGRLLGSEEAADRYREQRAAERRRQKRRETICWRSQQYRDEVDGGGWPRRPKPTRREQLRERAQEVANAIQAEPEPIMKVLAAPITDIVLAVMEERG
jgi:hypothetical protein